MRYHFWQFLLNQEGQPISNADIYVYEAGTTTDLPVYTSETGDSAELTSPQVKTNSNGYFEFWLGDTDDLYGITVNQKIKLKWIRTGVSTGEIDNINIFDVLNAEDATSGDLLVADGSGGYSWQDVTLGIASLDMTDWNLSTTNTGVSASTIWDYISTVRFDRHVTGSAWSARAIPEGWDASQDLYVKLTYVLEGSKSDVYADMEINGYFIPTNTTLVSTSPNTTLSFTLHTGSAGVNTDKLQTTTLSNQLSGSYTTDDMVVVELKRKGDSVTDDYNGDVHMLAIKLYQ